MIENFQTTQKTAICVKFVKFEPMSRYDYCRKTGISKDEPNDRPGYMVYLDNNVKWMDKYEFEKTHFQVELTDRITKTDVSNFIKLFDTFDFDDRTTLVTSETITGYKLREFSSCINSENYNRDIGEKIAFEEIVDKIYDLLGFVLQWCRNGLIRSNSTDRIKIESKINNNI